MAGECDQVRLLSDDAISTAASRVQPRKIRLQIVAVAAIAGVAAVAAWRKSFGAPASGLFDIGEVISAELLPAAGGWHDNTKCTVVGTQDTYVEVNEVKNRFWPKRFDDVNWQEHCGKDVKTREDCVSRLVEKYVGDYFDKVVEGIESRDPDWHWIPHDNEREKGRWKQRVIKSMQEQSKYLKRIEDPSYAPFEWAHKNIAADLLAFNGDTFPAKFEPCADERKCTDNGWICDAMSDQRPISARGIGNCGPNYNPWETVSTYFTTEVPKQFLCNKEQGACQSNEKEKPMTSDEQAKAYQQPGELDLKNEKLAACKHLLQPFKGEDWISATLTALDVRECIASSGAKPKSPYSRAWVRNCLPGRADGAGGQKKDEPRVIGWPGFVLEFISEYQIPESDCVKDYDGYLDTKGHCPATCEDGTSLTGHLRRYTSLKDYRVIHNRATPLGEFYWNLDADQMEFARYLMWKSGPLIGLVEKTRELVDCTRDDEVLFAESIFGCDNNAIWDKTTGVGSKLEGMSSVTVYGWGTIAGKPYWSFVSAFQTEGRIMVCGVKAFVVPELEQDAIQNDFYDKALNAFRAEAVCNRGESFCTQETAGYTATEDCDGDGVLDHWCYLAGEYEAFISSRNDCTVLQKACRRSVLPGRTFGCQRPLGWCMQGEIYSRNVDCDGDGHFDHVCEKFGHAGFISSSQDCTDTWEEGTAGRKCEPRLAQVDQDASITYKLVHDAGDCTPHTDQGSVCFKSHEDWPKSNYKPSSMCKFHIEATNHEFPGKSGADCGKEPEPETQLLLEVLYEDTEQPQYDLNGAFYGDKFALNSVLVSNVQIGKKESCVGAGSCIDWRPLAESVWPVYDKSEVEFSTDSTVEREGWLVCLRERSKIPKIYSAGCSEIGDDIWRKLYGVRKPKTYITVECDMDKCRKGTVSPVSDTVKNRFYRTTNLCDAGWSVAQKEQFDVEFSSPRTFDEGGATDGLISEPSFSVLA